LTQVFKIDLKELLKDEKALQEGKFSTVLKIHVKEAGKHKFKALFCDNYGFKES